MNRETKQISTQ